MSQIPVTIGIDIGGTNTVYGYVTEKGRIIYESSLLTKAEKSAEDLFERLFINIKKSSKKISKKYMVLGIGIGAPNANYYKGIIDNPPNLKWGKVNVIKLLKRYSDLPCVITNDANIAALGEMHFGAAKKMKNFVVITLGTGVGSGIIVDRKLLYGSDGFAGEIGHTIVMPNGRKCSCGRNGCLEAYASAGGIKNTALQLLDDLEIPSILRKIPTDEITPKVIYNAAKKNDIIALQCFNYTSRILGMKLADTVGYLSPEAIILFGGIMQAGDFILKPVKKYMEKNLFYIYKNKVKIMKSSLPGAHAAVLGGSALIWNELNNK